MKVIFPIEKETNSNKIVYPDDRLFFSNTVIDGNNMIAEYSGTKSLTLYVNPKTVLKSVYSNVEFMAKIPSNKLKLIKTSTDDDIEQWVFMLPMLKSVDLNDLPTWFLTGLGAMVTESIFTQTQIDLFLELN